MTRTYGLLEGSANEIRLNRAFIPDADLHLGVRRLSAELLVGVAEALADRVDTNERAGTQEVLTGDASLSGRVSLGPCAVLVHGEEFLRRELVLRVAVGGTDSVEGVRGSTTTLVVREALST